jgi:uncharacterized OB-fold protein
MNEVAPLLPDVKNPMLAPHWEAAARGRLAIRFCLDCDTYVASQYNCWLAMASSVARVATATYFIARKALHPSLADDVPYATAAVVLPVGVKLLGRLVGVELDSIRIGMPLRARYVQRSPDVTLVYWAPDTDGKGL